MVGTLSLGPHSEVRDVWQNLQDVGYCFELVTVSDSGQVKTNIFMVRCLLWSPASQRERQAIMFCKCYLFILR